MFILISSKLHTEPVDKSVHNVSSKLKCLNQQPNSYKLDNFNPVSIIQLSQRLKLRPLGFTKHFNDLDN